MSWERLEKEGGKRGMGNERRMRYARAAERRIARKRESGKRENARRKGGYEEKGRAKRSERVRENGYEPSMEFEACLNRLQLPERVDRGYRGLL